mmetsp:Transcript_26290/g.51629  ORF Transcript_26290/g.51629 Transcript_26290/m.51629 type:complete len:91 (-) Transcript_26290:211-483(-)
MPLRFSSLLSKVSTNRSIDRSTQNESVTCMISDRQHFSSLLFSSPLHPTPLWKICQVSLLSLSLSHTYLPTYLPTEREGSLTYLILNESA